MQVGRVAIKGDVDIVAACLGGLVVQRRGDGGPKVNKKLECFFLVFLRETTILDSNCLICRVVMSALHQARAELQRRLAKDRGRLELTHVVLNRTDDTASIATIPVKVDATAGWGLVICIDEVERGAEGTPGGTAILVCPCRNIGKVGV